MHLKKLTREQFAFRRIHAGAFLVGLLALGPGCGSRQPTSVTSVSNERPHAGQTIIVACPDATAQKLIDRSATAWEHRSGAKVQTTLYTADLEKPPAADVWIVRPADLPRHADALAALPSRFSDRANEKYRWSDIVPIFRSHLIVWNQRTVSVPLLGDTLVAFYRRDLYLDPAHQAAYQKKTGKSLQPPQAWEDWLEQAAYFQEGWRKEGSLPPLPRDPGELDRLFYSVAAPYARRGIPSEETIAGDRRADLFAFHFDLDTGSPRIRKPGFVHALGLLQKLQKHRPAGPAQQEPWQAFANGQAVLHLGPASLLHHFQAGGSAVVGKVGVIALPGSRVYFDYETGERRPADTGVNVVPYRGSHGFLAGVPSGSSRSEAAFSFLEELSGPELSRQIVTEPQWGGAPYRNSHLQDRWDSFRLEGAPAEELRTVLSRALQAGAQNPVVELRLPDARVYREQLLAGVRAALVEGKTAEEALTQVEAEWQKIIGRRGQAEHRRDYELSLGLRPTSQP